jgi:hypothetical protein
MKLNLRMFDGHSVTCYKDAGASAFSASPYSSVAKDAEVTLTVTLAAGYEVAEYEVITGGVTVDPATKKFTMGDADVVINLKTKANNKYMVTEECKACLNDGAWTVLHKNTVISLTPNGVPKAITVENGGATVTVNAAIQNLIDQGILVKI